MRMPWSRKDTDPLETDSGKALVQSEEGLAEVQTQWEPIRRVTGSLREVQRRNHFGESLARLMRGDV